MNEKSCIKDLKMIEIYHFIYMHFEGKGHKKRF